MRGRAHSGSGWGPNILDEGQAQTLPECVAWPRWRVDVRRRVLVVLPISAAIQEARRWTGKVPTHKFLRRRWPILAWLRIVYDMTIVIPVADDEVYLAAAVDVELVALLDKGDLTLAATADEVPVVLVGSMPWAQVKLAVYLRTRPGEVMGWRRSGWGVVRG